ncbi:hypothetical protein BCON_0013g00610 [Botryotinia convoluta]|uniref:Uncharacterized protein n=1 Tax=Botryotinia convoluta TaxID=54673 RepID=A0A4Z1IPY7_9HELO|nr:hypothetical protein BCON_0013g00610 [Botryotinia convoluta]
MMTTPKTNFKWNCATPCFVSKSRHLATSIYGSKDIDVKRSTGLPGADYSVAFETTEVRRCFGKIYEAHSQVINTRRTFPTTWVYPDYKGCSETASSPGFFTLPMAWNSDTIDSGDQRQRNRRTFSTRDISSTTPTVQEKAMFEAICRQYMSPTKTSNDLEEQVCTATASSPVSQASHTTAWRKKNEGTCTTCSSPSSESPSLNSRSLTPPAECQFVEEHNETKSCSPMDCQTTSGCSAEVESFDKSSPTMVTREPQAIPSTTSAGLDEEVRPKRARKRISRNMRMRLDRKAAAQILVSEHTSQQEDICLQLGICSHVSHSNNPLASIDEMPRE